MEKCLTNLVDTIRDVRALLDLSSTDEGQEHALVIYRRAIIRMVDSCEPCVKQLAESNVSTLAVRLRDASPLPEAVKQSIAMLALEEERGNPKAYSDLVCKFSGKGWKIAFAQYCRAQTTELNTALVTSAQGNRNKLCCKQWGLLAARDRKS